MSNKLREREQARRMLIEWSTRYMRAGDLQEAALALPLSDGRRLEIGLRMSDQSPAVISPVARRQAARQCG